MPRRLTTCSTLPFFLLLASPLLAQSSATGSNGENDAVKLSEFSVSTDKDSGYRSTNTTSGSRTNELIRNIPLTLATVNSEFIKDIGASDIYDMISYTAGVTPSTATVNNNGAVIRGFTSSFQLRNFFRWYAFSSSFNVERVEILKGPAAVLYAQAFPGGAINVVTKTPQMRNSYETSFRVGTDDNYRANIDYNVASKYVQFRLNGLWEKHESQNDFEDFHQYGLAPSLRFKPFANTVITLEGEFLDVDRTLESGISQWGQDVPARGILTGDLYRDKALTARFYGPDAYIRMKSNTETARIEHTFSENLSAQVSYNYQDYDRPRLAPNSVATGSQIRVDAIGPYVQHRWQKAEAENSFWAIQSSLAYKFDLLEAQNKLLVGFDGGEDHFLSKSSVDFVAGTNTARQLRFYINQPNLDYSFQAAGGEFRPNNSDNSTNTFAGYYSTLQSSWAQGYIRSLVGFRYDEYKTTYHPGSPSYPGSVDGNKSSPMVGLMFTPVSDWTFYALYSEAYTPNSNRRDAYNHVLPPITAKGYEAGIKTSSFNGRLSGTLSIYSTEQMNRSEDDPSPPADATNTGSVFRASGRDRAQGVDLDLIFTPVANWDITGSYSYVDAHVLKSVAAGAVGQRLTGQAFNQANVFTRYTFSGGWLKGAYVGGGVRFRSGELRRYRAGVADETSGFIVFSALLGYRWKQAKNTFRVAMNLDNLFDREYITNPVLPRLGDPFSAALQFTWAR